MIANNDRFIFDVAWDSRDGVPDRRDSSVYLVDDVDVNLARPRPVVNAVVSQAADPVLRHITSLLSLTLQRLEDRDSVLIRDW